MEFSEMLIWGEEGALGNERKSVKLAGANCPLKLKSGRLGFSITVYFISQSAKGDRRAVARSVKNLRFGGLFPGQVGLWRFRSVRLFCAVV